VGCHCSERACRIFPIRCAQRKGPMLLGSWYPTQSVRDWLGLGLDLPRRRSRVGLQLTGKRWPPPVLRPGLDELQISDESGGPGGSGADRPGTGAEDQLLACAVCVCPATGRPVWFAGGRGGRSRSQRSVARVAAYPPVGIRIRPRGGAAPTTPSTVTDDLACVFAFVTNGLLRRRSAWGRRRSRPAVFYRENSGSFGWWVIIQPVFAVGYVWLRSPEARLGLIARSHHQGPHGPGQWDGKLPETHQGIFWLSASNLCLVFGGGSAVQYERLSIRCSSWLTAPLSMGGGAWRCWV